MTTPAPLGPWTAPRVTRIIRKSSWRCRHEVRELLQAIFLAECLAPSRQIWLVSPWVSDIPVIDNRTGAFTGLDPGWTSRPIGLAELLTRLLGRDSAVLLATRDTPHNRAFVDRVRLLSGGDRADAFDVRYANDLHEKGLLTGACHLSGSMNFTHSGVEVLTEMVTYDTDPAKVAETRLVYQRRYETPPVAERS